MVSLSAQKFPFIQSLVISVFLLSGCGATTTKIGVPDSYNGKLVRLKVEQKNEFPMIKAEILEIDGKLVENPTLMQIYPGEYDIKSRCQALKGEFITTRRYSFKLGYEYKLMAKEDDESGECRAILMQYKTFAL